MAGIIDDEVENVNDILSDVSEMTKESTQVEQPQEEELPEKYKGKSAAEIIRMHQEAEKLIGKQGSEVGELRKVVDDFIRSQTSSKPQKQEEVEEVDFFADPNQAVNKAIDHHPAVREAKEASARMRQQETISKLSQKYPNWQETAQDPSFVDWLKGSRVRLELAARAESQYDFDAADELLSAWENKRELTKKVTETAKVDREQQLRKADVGSQGASETSSKKKYRRADIIKLMQTDPARYEAMQPEIMQAYAEKRVI
jgi:IS5 family transposase